jgi:hypothetical protein
MSRSPEDSTDAVVANVDVERSGTGLDLPGIVIEVGCLTYGVGVALRIGVGGARGRERRLRFLVELVEVHAAECEPDPEGGVDDRDRCDHDLVLVLVVEAFEKLGLFLEKILVLRRGWKCHEHQENH